MSMKAVTLTKSAKWSYLISAVGLIIAFALLWSGHNRIGAFLGTASMSFAISVAYRNRHMTEF